MLSIKKSYRNNRINSVKYLGRNVILLYIKNQLKLPVNPQTLSGKLRYKIE